MNNNDVEDLIHALRCCADMDCRDCPKFIEDNDNYSTLCGQALMVEAALMLEEYADGTRKTDENT